MLSLLTLSLPVPSWGFIWMVLNILGILGGIVVLLIILALLTILLY